MSAFFRAVKGFPRFVWDVAKVWYFGGIGDLAAGVTFWILITVPAAVLTLVSSASFLDAFVGTNLQAEIRFEILTFVNETFAEGAATLRQAVDSLFDQPQTGVFTFAAGLTLFTISRGFAGMIRALDTVYDVENGRPWYHTRFVGLILGLGTVLVMVPIVLLEVLVWSNYDLPFETTVSAIVSMAILVGWASLIFHYGPSTRTKWRWDLPGALVAAVFWWALSLGFGRYVRLLTFGDDVTSSSVLGLIGGFLLALTWIWIAAQVLLIGAAVNVVLGERLNLDRGRKRSVLNSALSTATGELKKVVVNGRDGSGEFIPKAVAQRLKPTSRARSVLDVSGTDPTVEIDTSRRSRVG